MSKEYIKDKVSIVLLCYKNREFLDEAIESILNQTYSNFEIIVAEDASNDGSAELIQQWAKRDSRIIPLIHERNLGMSANQNSGFERVTGEFIVPMSGDDILLPTKLEKQVRYLQKHPDCGLVLSMTQAFDTHSGEILYEKYPCQKPQEWFFRNDWFFAYPIWYGSHNNTSTMGRSNYYLQNHYDVRLRYKGEVLHALENYAKSPHMKWYGMNEILTKYRIHPNSATKNPELTKLIYEENWLVYAIASARHPSIKRELERNMNFKIFSEALYTEASQKSSELQKLLYYRAGIIPYLYCKLVILLFKHNLIGIISKPALYLKTLKLKQTGYYGI